MYVAYQWLYPSCKLFGSNKFVEDCTPITQIDLFQDDEFIKNMNTRPYKSMYLFYKDQQICIADDEEIIMSDQCNSVDCILDIDNLRDSVDSILKQYIESLKEPCSIYDMSLDSFIARTYKFILAKEEKEHVIQI